MRSSIKNPRFIGMALLFLLGPAVAWKTLHGLYAQASTDKIPIPAITAFYEETLDDQQSRRKARELTIAYRSDGGNVEIEKFFKKDRASVYKVQRTIIYPDRRKFTAMDSDMVVSSIVLPISEYDRWKNRHTTPKSDCATNLAGGTRGEKAEESQISGVKVFRIKDPKAENYESWHAPSLGCLQLSRKMTFRGEGGGITDTTTVTLTSYILGEPDEKLFNH